ncbi:hypothetical protein [Actinomadura darangshiensis]|uniref:hypothetical protein n=1 Tax=Actinomadura darangshiensis TaxID=705336 RepID=UPI00140BD679|nr:hypothetical protein [Actinomadura darangshiensis]
MVIALDADAKSLHVLSELRRLDAALSQSWNRQPKVAEFRDALRTTARDLGEH